MTKLVSSAALADQARPADDVITVVFVGGQVRQARSLFAVCADAAMLHNDLGVDNEEEGLPVAVCRDPTRPWPALWDELRHLD